MPAVALAPGPPSRMMDAMTGSPLTIPVLRFDEARTCAGGFDPAFLDALRTALHDIGFLQLTDFGAAPGQVAELAATTARFFDLPLTERMALDNRLSPHFRGYTRLGHEITAGRPDAREQIDFAPEQETVPRERWDAPFRLLEGPNQWPDAALPELRTVVMGWADLLGRVAAELTRALAACLWLPEDHFDAVFAGTPHWFGKLIRYVGGDDDGPNSQGVGPHADWGFLTLLLQDDTGGLQARPSRSEEWVDVPPLDGALVINVGEMLEVATHGYLVATEHRVLPRAPGTTRQSIGFFWSPRLEAMLEPVPLPPALAAEAPGVSAHEHNALLPRFGDNALKGWFRSHPEVAARHHPDLARAAPGDRR
jgi:isopenicillin N synthase-like dioxygenase